MKIKSNNLSQVVQAMQLHKPGDKFIYYNSLCVVKSVVISEKRVVMYISEGGGNFSPKDCDWITTEVE